jgi:hypothetical protein
VKSKLPPKLGFGPTAPSFDLSIRLIPQVHTPAGKGGPPQMIRTSVPYGGEPERLLPKGFDIQGLSSRLWSATGIRWSALKHHELDIARMALAGHSLTVRSRCDLARAGATSSKAARCFSMSASVCCTEMVHCSSHQCGCGITPRFTIPNQ